MPILVRILGAALLLAASEAAHAQTPPASPGAEEPVALNLSRADLDLVVALLRNSLAALHHANVTGNYTVLRDLASPSFRDSNTAAQLGAVFAPVRERDIDLGKVVLLDPQLTDARINSDGRLHLAGLLATEPVPLAFDLLYEAVDGAWLLFAISITPDSGLQPGSAPPTPSPAEIPPTPPSPTPGGSVPIPPPRP